MPHTFTLSDYPVFLAPLEESLPQWLRQRDYSRIFLITDNNVHRDALPVFLQKTGLPSGLPLVEIPAGEIHKNIATCERIWQAMFAARLDRKALVVNLGGGVIGDMGGFCAATFKRGVDFIQVPTTLLAMTDAAIGGKLGIDFQGIKNAIGVFRNPAAVFVDPAFLRTLPPRELRSGFAEVIKHALIGDPALWEAIQAIPAGALLPNRTDWFELLRASIAVKVRVVSEDPLEKGLRALLNFGHTIGHAIESYFLQTDQPLTHGEAVAIGMVCEASFPAPIAINLREEGSPGVDTPGLSTPPNLMASDLAGATLRHFPHTPIPGQAFPELWELMLQDKKNTSGTVQMAVPDAEPFSLRWVELTRPEMEQRLHYYNGLSPNP